MKKFISKIIVFALIVQILPQFAFNVNLNVKAASTIGNPVIVEDPYMESEQMVTWDCIWFGSYPQTEIVDISRRSGVYKMSFATEEDYEVNSSLYSMLKQATFNSNNDTVLYGKKYHRVLQEDAATGAGVNMFSWYYDTYHYFRYEPIKWRVLKVSNGKALLLADKILDNKIPYPEQTLVTWEKSTIRSWLNGYGATENRYGSDYSKKNFINSAFSAEEREVIVNTALDNSTTGDYSSQYGGGDTVDKVFLLSAYDVYNSDDAKSYGFSFSNCKDESRRCKSTTYAKAMGVDSPSLADYIGESSWRLRSPGNGTYYDATVNVTGAMNSTGSNSKHYYSELGIRPALWLDLSEPSVFLKAGTITNTDIETKQVNLIYDANGGDGAPSAQGELLSVGETSCTITISEVVPIRSGYTFLGWSTRQTSDVGTYEPGSTIVLKRDIKLYAVWKEQTEGVEKRNIAESDVEVESNLIYTGTPLKPKVTVVYGGIVLEEDKDYSVEYMNNTAVGTGSVIITGEGEYEGTITKSFVIKESEQVIAKQIDDCEMTLSKSSFEYNGESQIPEVIVKDGDTVLKKGVDYTVTGVDTAIDTGSYSITIVGQSDYSGSKEVSFKILPIKPVLQFESADVTKTIEDGTFTNSLDATTDGSITYFSDDTSVATVNASTGKVTIKGAGTTIIHATADAGKNYLAGTASYTLTVTEMEDSLSLSLENLSYSFGNTASAFQYPEKYNYPQNIYEMIFGKTTKASFWYNRDLEITGGIWRGNCAGFSGTAALLIDSSSGITLKDFGSSVNSIGQLNPKSKSSNQNIDVTGFIEAMQIAQHTQLFINEISKNRIYTSKHLKKNIKTLNEIYQTVRTETEAGRPVLLALYQTGAHAVLAYEVKDISETESQILLYDSNWPEKERVLTMKKDSNGNFMEWSYEIGGSYGTWGTDSKNSSISFVPYSAIKEIWLTRGHLQENENVLSINSGSVAIYTSGDKPVATVTQGELSTTIDEIQVIDYLSLEKAESDTLLLSVPVDVYTFKNLDKSVDEFEVSMTNTNLGASAVTTADSITMAVDDSCNLNAVYIDAGEDDDYSITLNSSFSYDEDNVVVKGKGNGEQMEVSQTKGNININNCQITSISIDGKEIDKYQIKASAGAGGKITPDGETIVTKGESVSYNIEALSGYEISDVLVDGKSVGSVSTYVFNNVTADHEIRAEFKKKKLESPSSENKTDGTTPETGKTDGSTAPGKMSPNQITAKNIVRTYSSKAQSFYVKATIKESAKLSYSSNNPSVKVAANGKVTVAKKYVGKASITIRSAATENYAEASKVITVTVNPTGTTIKNLKKTGSSTMAVTWKKNSTVTGYQINYSTSSNFKNAKTVTIKKNKTVKTVLKKPSKKKKYYVRIRTYKVAGGKKYYSEWSKKRGIKA